LQSEGEGERLFYGQFAAVYQAVEHAPACIFVHAAWRAGSPALIRVCRGSREAAIALAVRDADPEARVQRDIAVLSRLGVALAKGTSLLDFGCGAGATVKAYQSRGVNAWGCDVTLRQEGPSPTLIAEGRIREIGKEPYKLPFPDAYFDALVSDQVLEHVLDYPAAVAEMRRVLKPGGVCLHTFPSRLRPIEGHVFVPLASVVRSRIWLEIWARLGVRGHYQNGMTATETARANRAYLDRSTNYLSGPAILSAFRAAFEEVRFVERDFLQAGSSGRARLLARTAARLPLLFSIYRVFWNRVLFAR
jgi:SAM-dependent methyltransferase